MRHPRLVLPLAALLLAAAPAAAQQGDSATATPFRPGQWAVQFVPNWTTAAVGALKFRSARAAWVLDVRFDGDFGSFESSSGISGESEDGDVRAISAGLQLGTRSYRPVADRVNAYTGFGLLGSIYDVSNDDGSPFTSVEAERNQSLGAYGELGGNWMLNSHFALGARTQVEAGHFRRKLEFSSNSVNPSAEQSGLFVRLGDVVVLATIFF